MKRPRPVKAARRCCCGCFLWAIFIVALGGWWFNRQLGPISSRRQTFTVTIPPGAGSSRIAEILDENGLIRNQRVFLVYARYKGVLGRFRAGTYRLSRDMSVPQIVDRLSHGGMEHEDIVVTIPEGYTVTQIADTMEERGVISRSDEMQTLARGSTASFSASFPLPEKSLEGYLFPDTYRFRPNTPPQKVLQAMLDAFDREFYSRHAPEIQQSSHSLHEIVTIASLVEREAEVPQDRARIAGVIENRLKKKMRLEIDATLDYAKGRHLTRVLYKDLLDKSPYNTYRRIGLPPGPIASPGLASLEAALHPEQHDFLYYVAIQGKEHVFARTEAEHNKNVAKMRALRKQTAE